MSISSFSGSITIRERIAIPAGAIASVKLVAQDGEVLAATAIPVNGVPAEFDLYADSELLQNTKKLFFWAYLRSEVGSWGTLDLVAAKSDSTDIVLSRIPA